ncbi:DUF5077 domain-containing protein [Arenibacter sp. BSSL-BM3]|uniref:DUF5077 domain-containing protein n=1 Tax=Arenibacter arenosicollis TaxID=2762274 RepID=A0ABR7QN47_9FLAO|nr:DUF5077 domain-containing protein [Arenibacter arenosicollis]MBC8768601.1 DUF5077 domain-containing protein [Arenibacter arenosicollis]
MKEKTNIGTTVSNTFTKIVATPFIGYKNSIVITLLLCVWSCTTLSKQDVPEENIQEKLIFTEAINPGGNSWVVNNVEENQELISDKGIRNWNDGNTTIRTYFKTDQIGSLNVGLKLKVSTGNSKLKVSLDGTVKEVEVSNRDIEIVEVGTFKISEPGYHFLELQGLEKTGNTFAEVSEVLIGGQAANGSLTYVKEDFYWGRRGPSVHLSYTTPANTEILWFYNEITVPENEDVIGSYYMANGFGEGYFGMQVNSETERRVLFSAWSPFETQDPKNIPDDYKIIMLGKGEGVTTGEFGNEGSGGQSYKVFNWKAGNTYKFLLKGEPSVNNSTDYTAYFFDPETDKWNLIAGFRRPHTSTYLTRPHSFLENFRTEVGHLSRMGEYTNQWIYDTKGNWHELTSAKFTADATARKGSREDYAGGAIGNKFFMKNCGFFDEKTTMDTFHERTANGIAPDIEFSLLEKPMQ